MMHQMSEEGISACYVNSHSFVHDIVTLSQVGGSSRRCLLWVLICSDCSA